MYADWFVMLVAGTILIIWLYRLFYRWLHTPSGRRLILLQDGAEPSADDPWVKLLEANGYEVLSGKHRIPLRIGLDDQVLQSRLYIDYVAERDGKRYMVKTARERMPMDWTGAGVRDRLLVYSLLVPYCEGVLYADGKEGTVRVITFQIEESQ
ncbi:hypothetical protein [Paenibacillus sabuli]|nr:hypothetical protein [Paenibacillus sabuli]